MKQPIGQGGTTSTTALVAQLITTRTVQRYIGMLGMSLPGVMLLGSVMIGDCHTIQGSVSEYYFTAMTTVLQAMLCSTALLHLSYRGYDRHDSIVNTLAGISCFGIALFPTSGADVTCPLWHLEEHALRSSLHFLCAATFFFCVAYICLFLFPKTGGDLTKEKKVRNTVYRVSGVVILLAMLLMFLVGRVDWMKEAWALYQPIFWLEWVALVAYGISWLTKGKVWLLDTK